VGVGPRGYRRSDERIREDVCERFAQHGQLDPSDVEVAVRDGEVLLTGSVATRMQKRLAEDIAERVFGVVEVQNHLHVQRSAEAAQMPRGAPAAGDASRAHPSSPTHR
jgi:osmotically-inducible protein OsmY